MRLRRRAGGAGGPRRSPHAIIGVARVTTPRGARSTRRRCSRSRDTSPRRLGTRSRKSEAPQTCCQRGQRATEPGHDHRLHRTTFIADATRRASCARMRPKSEPDAVVKRPGGRGAAVDANLSHRRIRAPSSRNSRTALESARDCIGERVGADVRVRRGAAFAAAVASVASSRTPPTAGSPRAHRRRLLR